MAIFTDVSLETLAAEFTTCKFSCSACEHAASGFCTRADMDVCCHDEELDEEFRCTCS